MATPSTVIESETWRNSDHEAYDIWERCMSSILVEKYHYLSAVQQSHEIVKTDH